MKKEKRVVLFPHTHIEEDDKKMIPSSLMPITICKPWYMFIKEQERDLEILFPKNELKPPENFLKLLEESKLWMRGQDKGNALFMIMEKDMWNSDETLRRIKSVIKEGEKEEHIDEAQYNAIKWHLILHLASEYEQAQSEIDQKIKELSKGRSPLENVIEGQPMSMESMFKDVISSDMDPILDERVLNEIIMAWIGLFKEYVKEDCTFLTFNEGLFNYIKTIFEDAITKDMSQKEELPIREELRDNTSLIEVSFPILMDAKGEIETLFSNKRLICLKRS